jgi:mannosyltransferase OCH1-like enzyme
MNKNGHIIYIGNYKKEYFLNFNKEIKSFTNIQKVNLFFWDYDKIIKLIEENFNQKEMDAFKLLKPNAYKADLARLFILYIHGGWYSDFGITFLKKIEEGSLETIFFYDEHTKNLHKECLGSIQNSLMYSKNPKNKLIKDIIDYLVNRVLNKEYGDCYLDVTGPCAFYKSLKNIKLSEKDKIYKMFDLDYGFTYYDNSPTPVYRINNENVAAFKHFSKHQALKKTKDSKSDYSELWKSKDVYYQ